MNIVDSSGWLEYFSDGPNANVFAAPLRDVNRLLVPVVSIYEVFRVSLRERSEQEALEAASAMQRGTVLDVTVTLSLAAARLSLRHQLPMADSLILASARAHGATLWTQDVDFKGMDGVKYFAKK
jgi:predicted nucleic acid-binding protein